jgi:Tfp pilus assembly protein PilO
MKYQQQAQRRAAQLGVPGWLGVALGMMAAVAWLGVLPQHQSLLEEQQAQATHLRERLSRAAAGRGASAPELPVAKRAQEAWAVLWHEMPNQQQGMKMQADVLVAAKSRGVNLQTVQFNGAPVKALPGIWRQQMSLPVEAPYPSLRAWLAQLSSQSALSIDSLDINRTDPMSDMVKARVTVSLWWQVPMAGGQP